MLYTMRHFCIHLLVLSFLFASCNNIQNGHIASSKTTLINLDSGAKSFSLADALASEHVINLQTNDSSLISASTAIGKIIIKEGKIYILDNKFMAVKVFDSVGHYLFSLGKSGLAKGEFLNVQDMTYERSHNSILVLCNRPNKISEFSLDGVLLHETPLQFFASSIAIQPDGSRIFYVNQNESELSEKKNILITDGNNDLKSRMFDFPKKITSSIKFTGGVYTTAGERYFNPPFSSTYYSMSGDTATPVYEVSYGKKTIPKDVSEGWMMKNLKNYGYQVGTFFKNDNYVGFNYVDRALHVAFYNTRSGNLIKNDVKKDSLNAMFYNFVYECDGKLVMVLDVNGMSGFWKRNEDLVRQKLPDLYNGMVMKMHQNPSLMIFTLKDI